MKVISEKIILFNGKNDERYIYEYNDLGQEIRSFNYFRGNLYESWEFFYNKDSLLVKSVENSEDWKEIIEYHYDAYKLIKKITNFKEIEYYFYNDNNDKINSDVYVNKNLVKKKYYINEGNKKVELHYDNANKQIYKYEEIYKDDLLVKTVEHGENGIIFEEIKLKYDKSKKIKEKLIISRENGNQKILYFYNSLGLLNKEIFYTEKVKSKIIEYVYDNSELSEINLKSDLWGDNYTLKTIFKRIYIDEKKLLEKIKILKDNMFNKDYIELILNINFDELKIDFYSL